MFLLGFLLLGWAVLNVPYNGVFFVLVVLFVFLVGRRVVATFVQVPVRGGEINGNG